MPLSDDQKFTYRQALEFELKKPETPKGETEANWEEAWQKTVVLALTTSPRQITEALLKSVHEDLRDIIGAIHRYLNPYNFGKNRIIGNVSVSPLISDIHAYLFQWLLDQLTPPNQQRVGKIPDLPPELVGKRVDAFNYGEQLVYTGLNNAQNHYVTVLYNAYRAYLVADQTEIHFKNHSLQDLEALAYLVSPNPATNDEQDKILDDFFAIAAAISVNPDIFDDQYRTFKHVLYKNIRGFIETVHQDLKTSFQSLAENTSTAIALILSMSREQQRRLFHHDECLTPKRISALLSVTSHEEWKACFHYCDMSTFPNRLITNGQTVFDIFWMLPPALWPQVMQLPGLHDRMQMVMGASENILASFESIPIQYRWDLLMLPAVREMLPTLFAHDILDWYWVFKALPVEYALDFLFLPEVIAHYCVGISYKFQFKEIFQRLSGPRTLDFIKIPIITEKLADRLLYDNRRCVLNSIKEPYRTELLLIPKISSVLMITVSKCQTIVDTMKIIPINRRMEFLGQQHVKEKLHIYLDSGLKLSRLLRFLPREAWVDILTSDFSSKFSKNMKMIAYRLAKHYSRLLNLPHQQRNEAAAKVVADEFVKDTSGKFIVSAQDIHRLEQARFFLYMLPLPYWPKYFNLRGVEEFFKHEICSVSTLVESLWHMQAEKRWSFLIMCPGALVLLMEGLQNDSNDSDKMLRILDPQVGSFEHRKLVYEHMTRVYEQSDANDKRYVQARTFLFFHPVYEPQERVLYNALHVTVGANHDHLPPHFKFVV